MPNARPTSYRPSSLAGSRSVSATHARQDEALRLRETGLAYIDIARSLGYSGPQGAAEACRVARRRASVVSDAIASVNPVTAPVAAPAIPSNRTFGVECEFFGITPHAAVDALAAVGIDAHYAGYTHAITPDWKIVTDVSVTRTGTGVGRGLELVSPILRGVAGLEAAAKAVRALLAAGGKVDKSCGLHVHIGMDGLTGAQIMSVFDLYAANQAHINSVVARSRHSNRYCRPQENIPRYERPRYDAVRTADDVAALRNTIGRIGNNERFYTVNLTAYTKYGTVEFRQHQGTLNGEKLTSWVKFLLAIVEFGSAGNSADAGSFDGLLSGLSITDETKQFLTRRAASFAAAR
jgi:hypothetical protein